MMKAIADRERDSKIKAAFGLGHFRTYILCVLFLVLSVSRMGVQVEIFYRLRMN